KVAIEHDDVVGGKVQLGDRVEPVVGHVDGHALVAQALGDVVGQPRHVLGDEDPHEPTPAGSRARVAPPSSISTLSPPPDRARSSSPPPCASATAATIERPR